MEFGEKLRQLRELRGMTQEQLADAAGVHITAVSHWETGMREPTISNVMKLAKGLRLTPGNLLPREASKTASVCDRCGGHGLMWTPVPHSILRERKPE